MEKKNKSLTENIKKLRKMIPIGVVFAKKLLIDNNQNLEKARSSFISAEIKKICIDTLQEEALVSELFFEEDFDYSRTVDRVNDVLFDRKYSIINYKTTLHDLNMLDAWLMTIKSHGLMNSLQTKNFESVVAVVNEIGLPLFSKELETIHNYLALKEIEFSKLEEHELLGAVEQLKAGKEYQSILESYKLNVMLNPDFFKVLNRLRKNVVS